MQWRASILAISILSACAPTRERSVPSDLADVVYSMSRDQNDVLELSVYNPNEFSVCVSYSDWPGEDEGEGNVLRVTGIDGTVWTYMGLEIDTVGRAKNMRILPNSDATAHVNIRKNYKPPGSDDQIGKVYYGARFVRC